MKSRFSLILLTLVVFVTATCLAQQPDASHDSAPEAQIAEKDSQGLGTYLWLGRYETEERAQAVAKKLEDLGLPVVVQPKRSMAGGFFVVVSGPFDERRAGSVQKWLESQGFVNVRPMKLPSQEAKANPSSQNKEIKEQQDAGSSKPSVVSAIGSPKQNEGRPAATPQTRRITSVTSKLIATINNDLIQASPHLLENGSLISQHFSLAGGIMRQSMLRTIDGNPREVSYVQSVRVDELDVSTVNSMGGMNVQIQCRNGEACVNVTMDGAPLQTAHELVLLVPEGKAKQQVADALSALISPQSEAGAR